MSGAYQPGQIGSTRSDRHALIGTSTSLIRPTCALCLVAVSSGRDRGRDAGSGAGRMERRRGAGGQRSVPGEHILVPVPEGAVELPERPEKEIQIHPTWVPHIEIGNMKAPTPTST